MEASHFPHSCTLCGAPAYVSDFSTDCSKPGCDNHKGETIDKSAAEKIVEASNKVKAATDGKDHFIGPMHPGVKDYEATDSVVPEINLDEPRPLRFNEASKGKLCLCRGEDGKILEIAEML
jgi:hypothetical protein